MRGLTVVCLLGVAWALTVKLLSGQQCQKASSMRNQHGNGLALSGNKTLFKPILTQIYVAVWRHWATMIQWASTLLINFIGPSALFYIRNYMGGNKISCIMWHEGQLEYKPSFQYLYWFGGLISGQGNIHLSGDNMNSMTFFWWDFQMHFLEWKLLYIDTNFTDFFSNGPINNMPTLV